MATATMALAAPPGNSKPASESRTVLFQRHQADILAGGDGLESGRALGLLLGEIHANEATYARRSELARDLSVAVPQMESAARDSQDRADRLIGLADHRFDAFDSARWLVELGLPSDATLLQFAQGLVQYQADRLKGKQQALDASLRAAELRERLTRDLWASASKALHEQVSDARNRMLAASKKIEAADRWLRQIDARVSRAVERCERLFRGQTSGASGTPSATLDDGGLAIATRRRLYDAAKAELHKLQTEAATRPQVEADRASAVKDQAAALAERDRALAAMLLPENMRFHGET